MLVHGEDIPDQEESCVIEKIRPAVVLLLGNPTEAYRYQSDWDNQQKYTASPVTISGQSPNLCLARIRPEIYHKRQCEKTYEEELLKEPEMAGPEGAIKGIGPVINKDIS